MIDFDQVTGKMGSAEFRKRYASIDEPTSVYANGHYIGTWVPFELNDLAWARMKAGNASGLELPSGKVPTNASGVPAPQPADAWHLRPATPAPKPGQKGK